jgi:hypothetical protein
MNPDIAAINAWLEVAYKVALLIAVLVSVRVSLHNAGKLTKVVQQTDGNTVALLKMAAAVDPKLAADAAAAVLRTAKDERTSAAQEGRVP